MQTSTKVLFITNKIPHYRIPLYKELGKCFQLTIAHAGTTIGAEGFKEVKLVKRSVLGFDDYAGMPNLDGYDVIISYLSLRNLHLFKWLLYKDIKKKTILYGIGVAGSYTKKYDSSWLVARITKTLISTYKASVFYDYYPVIKYQGMGVNPNKLFCAPNTVVISDGLLDNYSRVAKDSFIFIGSLYREKGLGDLIKAYATAHQKHIKLPKLFVIGEGAERKIIEDRIIKEGLQNEIELLGEINTDEALAPYFARAYCCVSPKQAGLTVQKAFAFGVPFLTSNYPISGGEFTSIMEGVTGFHYDGTEENLLNRLIEIPNREDLMVVSENCSLFYDRFRNYRVWVNGFSQAISFVTK